MTVDEASDRLRQLLNEAGFNPARPDPALAWAAFKRFAAEPVAVETVGFWFEAADGDPEAGYPAYFDFVRLFSHDTGDGTVWGEMITAHFTAPPDVRLSLWGHDIHAKDVAALTPWFQAVEASPSFRAGAGYADWSFEVRIDGC